MGDNLYFGTGFIDALQSAKGDSVGATVFGYQVKDPSRYGVIGFDDSGAVTSLVEKPEHPASNYAVTGLYFYDQHAPEYAKKIQPSERSELEITALNEIYLQRSELQVKFLDGGTTWLDTGTTRSLLAAAQFVSVIEERQGLRICCPEVESFRQGWISADRLAELAKPLQKSGYGNYLAQVAANA